MVSTLDPVFAGFPNGNLLGVADTGETGPADVGAIGEVLKHVLRGAELLEHGRALDAGLEGRGGNGGGHGDV